MTARHLLSSLEGVKRNGKGWLALCPAHDDHNPSLSVRDGDNGGVLVHCFAGCSRERVCAALNIDPRDLGPDEARGASSTSRQTKQQSSTRQNAGESHHITATYDYNDEQGKVLSQVVRSEPKKFQQRRPNGKGGWLWNLNGTRRVLYRLPELLMADRSATVFICEGERDVDNLVALGLLATTNPGGAGKWCHEYGEALRGRHVCILPDNDVPGREHSEKVANSLSSVAASVRILVLADLPDKGDVSDWLEAGGTADQLIALATGAPLCEPLDPTSTSEANTLDHDDAISLPKLDELALYGLAGDIVHAIEPHSEADPAALLIQVLVAFGNCAGRSAYFVAENDRHHLNLFIVLVGATSKGRKGSSWGQVGRFFRAVDESWAQERIQSGLSSGEGLIWAVRNPIEKQEPVREKGRIVSYQKCITDEGVDDKRLLILEPEFASVLRVIERQTNTLSPIIRHAWDTGNLRSLTKNSPAHATGAHISIIGHITRDELRRNLDETETANGFANRFLWVCSRRSKLLPEGGKLSDGECKDLISGLRGALDHARKTRQLERDKQARALWFEVYEELSAGHSGLLGSVTSRAEAQVMRVACLYAVLDCAAVIRIEHLEAALALWHYCEDSARYIFGEATGDRVADSIVTSLREAGDLGLTRTEINNIFSGHKRAGSIEPALAMLLEQGRIVAHNEPTEGRPAKRYCLVKQSAEKANKAEKGYGAGASSAYSAFSATSEVADSTLGATITLTQMQPPTEVFEL